MVVQWIKRILWDDYLVVDNPRIISLVVSSLLRPMKFYLKHFNNVFFHHKTHLKLLFVKSIFVFVINWWRFTHTNEQWVLLRIQNKFAQSVIFFLAKWIWFFNFKIVHTDFMGILFNKWLMIWSNAVSEVKRGEHPCL